jgi:hypothetical protein
MHHVVDSKDVVLLSVYAHMIDSTLYLPDYPIGHLIAFPIEQQMKRREPSSRNSSAWPRPATSLRIYG